MLGKIIDYKISLSHAGFPMIEMIFKCEDGKILTWRGSLKPGKAQEITLDVILRCGFKAKDPMLLGAGPTSKLLDMEKSLELKIEQQEWNGKMKDKISWISTPGSAPTGDYKELNLVEALAQRKLKKEERDANKNNASASSLDDDVLF